MRPSGSTKSTPELRSIGLMSHKYGITLRTLRFYEETGLLSPTRVGRDRFYGPRDEIRLQLIATGKRLGLTLAEIAHIIDEYVKSEGGDPPTFATMMGLTGVRRHIGLLEKQRRTLDKTMSELRRAEAELIRGRSQPGAIGALP